MNIPALLNSWSLHGLHLKDLDLRFLLSSLTAVIIVSRIIAFTNGRRATNYLPGLRPPFQPLGLPGVLIPTTWWNTGLDLHWARRFKLYKDNESFSIVPSLVGPSSIWTSNLDVARQVASGGHKSAFIKPESASRALLLWGMNLAASEGEMWRKHRRVMGPAFNSQLYRLVWDQTITTYRDMIESERWSDSKTVDIPAVQALTFKFALLLICTCAFGFSAHWDAPPATTDGSMSVQEAIRTVTDTHMFEIFTPGWVKNLPFKTIQRARAAHDALTNFMKEQISRRKSEIGDAGAASKSDVFSLLVQANENEESKYQLNDEELIGNVFVVLLAGHETSAHTLAATLGFLAVNDDIQDEVLEQIISVVGYDRDPEFEDYNKLNKVMAVFFEALRLFPSGHILIREATEDTVIQIPNPRGQEGNTSFPVPKGMQVVVDMVGIQYNPRYFDEPEKYKPSRWYGINNDSEMFTAFSVGPRACIGRRFATTEAVCFLALLLRDWKVQPKLSPGETNEQWRARVLDAKIVLTLGVTDVPLTFVRRK